MSLLSAGSTSLRSRLHLRRLADLPRRALGPLVDEGNPLVRPETMQAGAGGDFASADGTTEIVLGIVMTILGFGSFLFNAPFVCCGFAIFGPILFIVGLSKALRGPSGPTYVPSYYPPPYPQPPPVPGYAPTAPHAPPPQPVPVPEARKRSATGGAQTTGRPKSG